MGTKIIIRGADFSDSPLGIIRDFKTIAEAMVNQYEAAIGMTTYHVQLKAMVISLLENGLLDGIDIYPMLGNSLSAKAVNLNLERGLHGAALGLGANAINESDCIRFDQDIDAGTIANAIWVSNKPMENFYLYSDMLRTKTSPNASPLYAPTSGSELTLGGRANTSTGATSIAVGYKSPSYTESAIWTPNTTRKRISTSFGRNSIDLYADMILVEEKVINVDMSVTDNFNPAYTNVLGTKDESTDAANYRNFDGKCWFFVMGYIEHDKRLIADAIFKTFLDSVKPLSLSM